MSRKFGRLKDNPGRGTEKLNDWFAIQQTVHMGIKGSMLERSDSA
jgi:hypothetical protein